MKSYITSSLLLVASPLASAWVFPSSIQSCRAAVSTRLLAMQGADVSSRRNFFGQIGAFAATGLITPSAAFASTPSISATEFTDLLLQGAENDEIDSVHFSGNKDTGVLIVLRDGSHFRLTDVIDARQIASICDDNGVRTNFASVDEELQREKEYYEFAVNNVGL